MQIQAQIEQKLAVLAPTQLSVINESHQHNVPANSETHFKIVMVSPQFADMRQVARHQQIYQLLGDELKGGVHALALHLFTEQEWQAKNGQAPASPDCMGGSKK